MARQDTLVGTVIAFDPDKGWGTVQSDDGHEHWFHCTAIADGTRRIDEGSRAVYVVVPGRRGRWEASGLAPA